MKKMYYQRSFNVLDGDVAIRQYVQEQRPSGIILAKRISNVMVTCGVSTEELVDQLDEKFGFHYEPDPDVYKFARIDAVRPTERFSVGPYPREEFCIQSAEVIARAYKLLTFDEVPPRIEFEFVASDEDIAEDDNETFKSVAATVSDIINGVHQQAFAAGQYL